MNPFSYARATSADEAIATLAPDRRARYIAGGTNIVDLMIDAVETPSYVVDINALPFAGIERRADVLHIGALARMSDTADHPDVKAAAPFVSQALDASASAQLRNAATIGGNVLQRTRCAYFRDITRPCNKREAASGCSALGGENRMHAILGGSDACIATHASDLAVALVASDARLRVRGPHGERIIALRDFYVRPVPDPQIETTLHHGELITAIDIPLAPVLAKSVYLKVRDRQSYEFALTSIALALDVAGGTIRDARLALGGVATIPWRSAAAERALIGSAATRQTIERAADLALDGATGRGHNDFKIALTKRTLPGRVREGERMTAIGAPLTRVDGRAKVTGTARYSAENTFPNLAYAALVLSTIPYGSVRAIETAVAKRMPGVLAVYTHENAPPAKQDKDPSENVFRYLPILQDAEVRYDRQPVGLVVADTYERAIDAAAHVLVSYNKAQAQTDFTTAPTFVPPPTGKGPQVEGRGDADAALGAAAVRIDSVYTTPQEHHNPMEPHATVAVWNGDALTVYDATQGVFPTRKTPRR